MSSRTDGTAKVDKGFVDAHFSSGDSKKTWKCKQQKEENNNEVDGLSEELQMGCIVDAVKRPPNICVETCVYEESDSEASVQQEAYDEALYTDDFEEDESDDQITIQSPPKPAKSESDRPAEPQSTVKLSKSHSFMSSKPSISGKSGRSSQYGSLSVPQTRRVNMSFTNERLREIERHNHILLNKILVARNHKKSSIPAPVQDPPRCPPPAAAVNRKRQQQQINHENMILLRKIQRAKSSSCSIRR